MFDKTAIAWAICRTATPENLSELSTYGNAGPFADAVIAAVQESMHVSGVSNQPLNATPPSTDAAGEVERAYLQGQLDMRERAAKVCNERGAEEQANFGSNRATQNYFRARNAVRDLEPIALTTPKPDASQGEALATQENNHAG